MKIKIKFNEKKKLGLTFWIPLSLVRTKLFRKHLLKKMIMEELEEDESNDFEELEEACGDLKESFEDIDEPKSLENRKKTIADIDVDKVYQEFVKPFYDCIKKYIKENGHFIFVEVVSDDVEVRIKI